jgi:hypothetical protein
MTAAIKVTRAKPLKAARRAPAPIARQTGFNTQSRGKHYRQTIPTGTSIAGPVRICNASTAGSYSYNSSIQAPRPGADNCLVKPSRVGDRLVHRDGRVTDLNGNPITSKT